LDLIVGRFSAGLWLAWGCLERLNGDEEVSGNKSEKIQSI
jgi:hypothetical protein